MKISRIIIAAALALASLCACEKEINFVGDYDGEKLVLYSTANTDTTLYANIFKSAFILSDKEESIFDHKRGATVTAEVGGRTINLVEDPGDLGRYISDYRPSAGETITIHASLPGLPPVSSVTTVPEKPDFKVELVKKEVVETMDGGNYGTVRVSLRLTIKDRPGVHDCYSLSVLQLGDYMEYDWDSSRKSWLRCALYSNDVVFRTPDDTFEMIEDAIDGSTYSYVDGIFDDQAFDGETHVFDLWFDQWVTRNTEYLLYAAEGYAPADEKSGDEPDVPLADLVDLSQYRFELDVVSEDIYLYQKTLAAYNGGDLLEFFGEPVSIHNNIIGGIGCFGSVTPSYITMSEIQ